MIKVSVMYPYSAGARFDHDYYRDQHMPLLKARMGEHCLHYTIDRGLAGGTPGSDPTYVAVSYTHLDVYKRQQWDQGVAQSSMLDADAAIVRAFLLDSQAGSQVAESGRQIERVALAGGQNGLVVGGGTVAIREALADCEAQDGKAHPARARSPAPVSYTHPTLGFRQPNAMLDRLQSLRPRSCYLQLPASNPECLDALGPRLIDAAAATATPDATWQRRLDFL